jgi:hypothetical protein
LSGSIANATNSNLNNITNNITNITNINDNDNIPFVYPFGYENINFLTENEVLEILKSTDGANLVLEKIYSQIENNNFMKFNKKDKHMVYIDGPNIIKYCNDKEFIIKLYEQSKLLLQRVFFLYFKRLSTKHQNIVWQNIQTINDVLDNKSSLMEDKYCNLINKNINDSEKKKLFNIIKKAIETKDKKAVDKNIEVYNKKIMEIDKLNNELNNKTLNMNEINNMWEQLYTDETVSYNEFENDLTLHRFEDTPRFTLIQTLIKKELDYIHKQELSIGDLNDFYNHIQLRISTEIREIREHFTDISDDYIEEIKNILINKPSEENTKLLQSIKLNNNSEINIITDNNKSI